MGRRASPSFCGPAPAKTIASTTTPRIIVLVLLGGLMSHVDVADFAASRLEYKTIFVGLLSAATFVPAVGSILNVEFIGPNVVTTTAFFLRWQSLAVRTCGSHFPITWTVPG
jgi:hypothetical protein